MTITIPPSTQFLAHGCIEPCSDDRKVISGGSNPSKGTRSPFSILALDPSSTCVGYALLAGLRPEQLLDGGLLRARPAKLQLFQRVPQFASDLLELLAETKPATVVVEVSITRHGRANDRGAAATLGVYGFAVGYLMRTLESSGVPFETVDATRWTGRVPKPKRTARIASIYGSRYPGERDRGGDLADAIGLGRWWLQRAGSR